MEIKKGAMYAHYFGGTVIVTNIDVDKGVVKFINQSLPYMEELYGEMSINDFKKNFTYVVG